jgi:hypothetical protein
MSTSKPSPDKKLIFNEIESQDKSSDHDQPSLVLDTSLGHISATQEFIGYKALIGKSNVDQQSLPESLELEESLQPTQFLEQSRLEPGNAFQVIETGILKELSVSKKQGEREQSVCLYSGSSRSDLNKADNRLQSSDKGFFLKSSLGQSIGDGGIEELERKRKKMKIWAGIKKFKEVENPSIGLDLSHRSKSIGPRRERKKEIMIREEQEPDESIF